MDDYPLLLDAAATGLRITHSPSTAKDEINAFFTQRIPGACDEVANKITNLDPKCTKCIISTTEMQYIYSKTININIQNEETFSNFDEFPINRDYYLS